MNMMITHWGQIKIDSYWFIQQLLPVEDCVISLTWVQEVYSINQPVLIAFRCALVSFQSALDIVHFKHRLNLVRTWNAFLSFVRSCLSTLAESHSWLKTGNMTFLLDCTHNMVWDPLFVFILPPYGSVPFLFLATLAVVWCILPEWKV